VRPLRQGVVFYGGFCYGRFFYGGFSDGGFSYGGFIYAGLSYGWLSDGGLVRGGLMCAGLMYVGLMYVGLVYVGLPCLFHGVPGLRTRPPLLPRHRLQYPCDLLRVRSPLGILRQHPGDQGLEGA
jgi:hypothetical protein